MSEVVQAIEASPESRRANPLTSGHAEKYFIVISRLPERRVERIFESATLKPENEEELLSVFVRQRRALLDKYLMPGNPPGRGIVAGTAASLEAIRRAYPGLSGWDKAERLPLSSDSRDK